MPNWVYNSLSISGDEGEIKRLEKQLATPYERTAYDLGEKKYHSYKVEKVISLWNAVKPDDLEAYEDNPSEDQSGFNHWYLWNIRNWGTKWDVRDEEVIDREEGHIAYQFNTAWSPPIEAITTLSEQFPTLDFNISYQEEGNWGGELAIKDGLAIETDNYAYRCYECDNKFQDLNEVVFNDNGYHQCVTEGEVVNA